MSKALPAGVPAAATEGERGGEEVVVVEEKVMVVERKKKAFAKSISFSS